MAIKTGNREQLTGNRGRRRILIPFIVLCSLLTVHCTQRPQVEYALGTFNAVHLFEGVSRMPGANNRIYSRIFSRIHEIDRTMSAFPGEYQDLPDGAGMPEEASEEARALLADFAADTLASGVVAVNRQAGVAPVKVRADIIEVLETALYYAELSGGAFDPTIGPLVTLWGIGTENQKIPDEAEIAAALELVDWRDLVLDREAGTAFLRREGMALDLGAIAKGYAGDEAARIAREAGVQRAIIDLGGNIVVLGWREKRRKESLPWRIGIQHPMKQRGEYMGILPVHDMSVVTSGVYERYFISGGTRYHHILSTADGYPVHNGLASVTIVTESSTIADALSTVAFTLGFEQGKAVIESIPGVEAVFIFDDRRVSITGGLDGIFILANDEFTLLPQD